MRIYIFRRRRRRRRPTLVVRIRDVPLFVSFRERTFALVSTRRRRRFDRTRCLGTFSLCLCVCFLRRFLCVFERSSTFCHSFSRLANSCPGKRRRRDRHLPRVPWVGGGSSHVVGTFLRDLHEIVHALARHQIEQTGFHFTSAAA